MKIVCLAILFSLMAAAAGLAQTVTPPGAGDSTNQMSVKLGLFGHAEPLHAPATVHIFARVSTPTPGNVGDKVEVDFFADTKPLASRETSWHKGIRPDPHSNRPQPMIVSLPGFSPVVLDWTNVPAGTFTLTARASAAGGVTAVSPPVNITILP